MPDIFTEFQLNLNFNKSPALNFAEIRPVRTALTYVDGRTEGLAKIQTVKHGERNRPFSRLCERA